MRTTRIAKKLIVVLLATAMVFTPILSVSAASVAGDVFIDNEAELMEFAKKCTVDTYSVGKTFYLMSDIRIESTDFKPIPLFCGTFEGGNHTISGKIGMGGTTVGLFRYNSGVIRNLNADISTSSTEAKSVGGVVGFNRGTLENCLGCGDINAASVAGGLVGLNYGEITDSTFVGTVSANHYAGGISGYNAGTIIESENRGNIDVNVTEGTIAENEELLSDEIQGKEKSELINREVTPITTDVGGVAGFSNGKILSCMNSGSIGHAHVGYNIGGIVGRQKGIVNGCKNEGNVRGRKDVGGIVGQNVPFISSSNSLESQLQNELNKLYESINVLLEDAGDSADAVSAQIQEVCASANYAINSAGALAGLTQEFVDNNIDQANEITKRINKAAKMLEPAANNFARGADDLSSSMTFFSKALDELIVTDEMTQTDKDRFTGEIDSIQENNEELNEVLDELAYILENAYLDRADEDDAVDHDLNTGSKRLTAAYKQASKAAQYGAKITSSLSIITGIINTYYLTQDADGNTRIDRMGAGFQDAAYDLEKSTYYFKDGMSDINDLVGYLASNEQIVFSKLGDSYSDALNQLNTDLNKIFDNMAATDVELNGSIDIALSDMVVINKQFNTVMNLIAEILDSIDHASSEDVFVDKSESVLASSDNSVVKNCINKAEVKADRDAGGIVGAMALELDFDPEYDESGLIGGGITATYESYCIVDKCVNYGNVTAKSEYCGGVAGLQETGIINGGQGYGNVKSESSGYVGGIAGYSLANIKNSYAKCNIDGSDYLGGIAGKGQVIKNCCTMVQIDDQAVQVGTIAGDMDKDGEAASNYYNNEDLGGIDGVSYAAYAKPMSYNEMLGVPGLPSDFSKFKLTFVADDRIVDELEFEYGDSIPVEKMPQVPRKDGYIGKWSSYSFNNLKFSETVEAIYTPENVVLSSDKLVAGTDKPVVLVEGSYNPETKVQVTETDYQKAVKAGACAQYRVIVQDIENNGDTENRFHVYVPNENKEYTAYIKTSSGWKKSATEMDGNYAVFNAAQKTMDFYIVESKSSILPFIIIGAVVMLGAVAFIIIRWRLRNKEREV